MAICLKIIWVRSLLVAIVVSSLMLLQVPRVPGGEFALLALVKRYLNEGILSLHHNVASATSDQIILMKMKRAYH